VNIPQSNVIFFYLFAAFFVFITMRGELRKYMGFLFSTPTASGGTYSANLPPVGSTASNTSPDWKKISDIAQVAAGF